MGLCILPFVASGMFLAENTRWLLMLSCECTSVYRLNLIMHNYYSYALLTTFWCIYCTSTNIKPIIVLNGEHQMSFNAKAIKMKRSEFAFCITFLGGHTNFKHFNHSTNSQYSAFWKLNLLNLFCAILHMHSNIVMMPIIILNQTFY